MGRKKKKQGAESPPESPKEEEDEDPTPFKKVDRRSLKKNTNPHPISSNACTIHYDQFVLKKKATDVYASRPKQLGDSIRTRYVTIAVDGSYEFEKGGVGGISDDRKINFYCSPPSVSIGHAAIKLGSTEYELHAVVKALEHAKNEPSYRDFGIVLLTDSTNVINSVAISAGSQSHYHVAFGKAVYQSYPQLVKEIVRLAGCFSLGVWLTHIPRSVISMHIDADILSRNGRAPRLNSGNVIRLTVFIEPTGVSVNNPERKVPTRFDETGPSCLIKNKKDVPTEGYLKRPIEDFLNHTLNADKVDVYSYFSCKNDPSKI